MIPREILSLAQFQFDWHITIGNVLAMATFLSAAITWMWTGAKRLSMLESWRDQHDRWASEQAAEQKKLAVLLNEVSLRLERLDERHRLEDMRKEE